MFRDFKVANDEIRELLLVRVADGDVVVNLLLALGRRPVLDAHHLEIDDFSLEVPSASLIKGATHFDEIERLREHDDAAGVHLPNETPEVGDGPLVRSLGHDVRVRFE